MTRNWIVFVLAIAACGGKKEGGDKDKAADKPAVTIDIAAVNALVPAALKDKVVFEKRDIVIEQGRAKTTYTMAVPKGWTQEGKMFAHVKSGGFLNEINLGSNCDGSCEPKDWASVSEKVNFKPYASGKILKDEKGPGRRTMISEIDESMAKKTMVVIATWTDGAKKYFACTAKLDESIKDAAPAFEKACSAVNVDGED